jgi:cation:H+ antiporter
VFSYLSLPILVLIFVGAAAAVWVAGIRLSDTTDVLSSRFGLGEALGGLILLAVPERLFIVFALAVRLWMVAMGVLMRRRVVTTRDGRNHQEG